MERKFWFIIRKRTMEVISKEFDSFEDAKSYYDKLYNCDNYIICETVYG